MSWVSTWFTMPASVLGRFHVLVSSSSRIDRLVSLLHSKNSLSLWLKTVRHFSFTDDHGGSIKKPITEYNRRFHSFPPRFGNHGRTGHEVDKTNNSSQIDLEFQGRNMTETRRDVSQSEEAKRSTPNQPHTEYGPLDFDCYDFKNMEENGFLPIAVAMLDGLCNDGQFKEALRIFGFMKKKGTIPGVVLYTNVVEAYTKAHEADDAKRIFRKMQSSGISPNAFSYNVLIQGLCECSRLQDAFEFYVEMLEAGHSPNVTTFVGLVEGFCKEKGVEEAKDAIRTLTEKGFVVKEKAVR
ncbi:pentatricopeptide repeat-containing protein At4g38150-like isoform X2 [Gastrolobium bilobum]|uniref:pentatricopeptide repeat-containing protein At4g38150-like isoform X2 n=1 Tax=Gastrolobium bilobum TaxID=150636 RepID=UPI002AB0C394|nr:pentatricopeptide repeat-containing protein At4g38150-like isoform X2 [Gastrolobium bilobum]